MPRRRLLTEAERDGLLAISTDKAELIRLTTFSDQDIALINQHRGEANRLGFAIQLCYLRYPGNVLEENVKPAPLLLNQVAKILKISEDKWLHYAIRSQTRCGHLQELYTYLSVIPYSSECNQKVITYLKELATLTDKGLVLAEAMIAWLRQHRIVVPAISVIERVCSEALTLGTRQVFATLNDALSPLHRMKLDALLKMSEGSHLTPIAWLRQAPGKSNAKHVLLHIDRLKAIEALALPESIDRLIHQNRLLKLAREGGQMVAKDLSKFEPTRRYATLVAMVVEARATLIDEIVNLHDRIVGKIFSKAKRIHGDQLQQSGKAIHAKLRQYLNIGQALVSAKQVGNDPFKAIEQILPWDEFEKSLKEIELLAKRDTFDSLYLVNDSYITLRKYTPEMLAILKLKAAPAALDIMAAIGTLKDMNERQARKVPEGAPESFIPNRWKNLVMTDKGIDKRYYELCVLSELKGALRSGDIWVQGSRQFKDFDDYLIPIECFKALQEKAELPLAVQTHYKHFIEKRLELLKEKLTTVNRLALADQLPDAVITNQGLRITPLEKIVPDEAEILMAQVSSLLPHIKITELLLEVDNWTGFTRHFTHMKTTHEVEDKNLLLTAILADGINLGLSKMAESCPGTTYAKLAWLQAWHIRDETYAAALAELVNFQAKCSFSTNWGDGTTSSSDGQNFRAGGHGQAAGQVNLKYGQEPGIQLYTHVSDQYSPYHVQLISAGVRDSTHVLDGLLYHESDLRIEEHYTDTAGFTDHVFALMHLLGFRFAPRIRDLKDKWGGRTEKVALGEKIS